MMIKLDLAKAYDKMSWKYMRHMLKAFGFCHDWVKWVLNLVSSTFFSIIFTGTLFYTFQASRGIRKGDPLSPFLFILMVEGLGKTLKAIQEDGRIRGLGLHEGETHHTRQKFMDDTMLMGQATVKEARGLKEIMEVFKRESDLEVNEGKS